MADGYRSYVVRVRSHPDNPESTRLEVEDLLGGRRRQVVGDSARKLGDELESLVSSVSVERAAPGRVPDSGLG